MLGVSVKADGLLKVLYGNDTYFVVGSIVILSRRYDDFELIC